MPLMRPPPGFRGSYNGAVIDTLTSPGVMFDVLERDVAAHLAEGWEVYADTTLAAPAAPDEED